MASTCLQTDFFEQLRSCAHPVLLLDYDGTLTPFTVERDRPKPYPGVIESPRRICRTTGTRTIFITGRTASGLDCILRHYGLNCEIWGGHGRERLQPDGTCVTFEIEHPATEVLQQADNVAAHGGAGRTG